MSANELACLNCDIGPFDDADVCPNCGADHALVWTDEYKRHNDGSLVFIGGEQ